MFTDAAIPFWTAVGSIAAALGGIGAFVAWVISRRATPPSSFPPTTTAVVSERSQLAVRRVVNPEDQDLPAAYDIYCSGITNLAERDSFPEIQRWLADAQTARAAGSTKLDEYLLVASIETKVCAFFYGQYYPSHRMFLIGYLVIDRKSQPAKRATSLGIIRFMYDLLKQEHPECQGIVFELALELGRDPRARIGKEELFAVHARSAAGVVLKRLDIEYVQPKLTVKDTDSKEEQQHLVYGRMDRPPLGHSVPKAEVVHVLDVVYNCWYGDYYLDDDPAKDSECRQYVRRMFDKAVANLPDLVPLR